MKGDTMRRIYNNTQAAEKMAVGFEYRGMIYYYERPVVYFLKMFKYDHTSKSHGRIACLRFKPTAEQKRAMIANHAIPFGDSSIFFQRERHSHENKGQTWERYLYELYDGKPCKARAWWNGGDFLSDGHIVQVKYENATVCTAKQCREHK